MEETKNKTKRPAERFVIDRAKGCDFFFSQIVEEAGSNFGGSEDAGGVGIGGQGGRGHVDDDRGLSIRYLKAVADKCWDEETVRRELHTLRAHDEEEDVDNRNYENEQS